MKEWQSNLPDDLKFHGPQSPRSAGLLHLLFSSVSMIFWRVFMRISYSCPAHLKFGLTIDQWTGLVQMTGDSIDWLDAHEDLYDIWMLVAYAATSCALVQVRNTDINSQILLWRITLADTEQCHLICISHAAMGHTVSHMGSSQRYERTGETSEASRLRTTVGGQPTTRTHVDKEKGRCHRSYEVIVTVDANHSCRLDCGNYYPIV